MGRATLALIATVLLCGFTAWVAITQPNGEGKALALLGLVPACLAAGIGTAAAIGEVRK